MNNSFEINCFNNDINDFQKDSSFLFQIQLKQCYLFEKKQLVRNLILYSFTVRPSIQYKVEKTLVKNFEKIVTMTETF